MADEFETSCKTKRRRLTPAHRWSEQETRELLEGVVKEVKDNPNQFEKPVAQKFYAKIATSCMPLSKINWVTMKAKMRHCKTQYMSAMSWQNQTGAGLLAKGEETSVLEYINKICPNFSLLEQIFSQRKNVNVNVVIETNDMEDEFDNTDIPICDLDESQLSPTLLSPIAASENSFTAFKNSMKSNVYPKTTPAKQSSSIGLLMTMHEKKFEVEASKLELEKRKEENVIELKKLELKQQLEIKKLEMEHEERLAMAKFKMQNETEEKIRKYELDLKYKNNH